MTRETQRFLEALGDLHEALNQSKDMRGRMLERIAFLRSEVAAGNRLTDVVGSERSPVLVQLLTESSRLLQTYGVRVRRTEARALYSEGVTMDEIARLFGVSRQRVSALLRDSPSDATA